MNSTNPPVKSMASPGHEHSHEAPISVHDMTVAYDKRPVLWDVDLDIPEGKLVGIIGPNGAGKSTFIKAIQNLVPRVSGSIQFYGKPLEEQRHLLGYVPQRESVDWDFPVNALDVVLMGRYRKVGWFRRIGKNHREAALAALDQLGMAGFAKRQISQLSGGQQQRVFLARALAQEARIYLMDEPLAGVDMATEETIFGILQGLRNEGKTVLVVHHDLQTVRRYFDHLILLNMRVVAHGPTSTVFHDENLRKTYGGKLTLLSEAADALAKRP